MTSAICALMSVQTCYASPPAIEIIYSPTLDSTCAIIHGYTIKPEWSKELGAILPGYKAEWSREGPKILSKVEELANKSFTKIL